ncbi:MAG: hypothetical protein QOD06_76 [Candidatus Binatota bacterium]|jgi:predicted negative regulator of RcsB-dependent stress response|nr:hypothetical protein [Candidatus Binatota bacterium]
MAKEETAAGQQELQEAVWQYTGWGVLLALVLASGTVIGYLLWGDAPNLRTQLQEASQKIQAVRSERENLNYEISRLKRANEKLQRDLDAAKTASPPADGGAAAATGGAPAAGGAPATGGAPAAGH